MSKTGNMKRHQQTIAIIVVGFIGFLTLKYGLLPIVFSGDVNHIFIKTNRDYGGSSINAQTEKRQLYTNAFVSPQSGKQFHLPGRFGQEHQHSAVFVGASFSYVSRHRDGSPPDASDLLTHLKSMTNKTKMAFYKLGADSVKRRKGLLLSIGIVHSRKHESAFLNQTLPSLFTNIFRNESRTCLLVILLCDIDHQYNARVMKFIRNVYADEIENGMLEVLIPPFIYYPDLEMVAKTADKGTDSIESYIRRSKENLDTAFLVNFMHSRSQFVTLFQDDVIFKPHFYREIVSYIKHPPRLNWLILRFSNNGALTKNVLVKSQDCPQLANFLLMFYRVWRLDQLFEQYITVLCRRFGNGPKTIKVDFPKKILDVA